MKRKLDHSGKGSNVDGALERAKLADVRYQLPYMSQSALSELCKWSRDHNGLPELYSRSTIQRARDEYIDINTPYGKLVQECELPYKDGGFMKLEMLNPLAAIYHTLSSSSSIGQVYAKLLETQPQPWHLIVYNDEITPGNQLAHKHSRKTQAIYFSFLELGPLLAGEQMWWTATLAASKEVSELRGGMSAVIGTFIRQFWTDKFDITTGGLSIPLAAGKRIQFMAEYGVSLSDELALHMQFMSKGSSGLKCCIFCSNCYDAKTTRSSVRSSPWARVHTCPDIKQFVPNTSQTITAIVTALRAAASRSKKELEELQTTYGFTYDADTILFDDFLRAKICPSIHALYDWMHVLFVTGVFNHTFGKTMSALRKTRVTYEAVHDFLQRWTWPHALAGATGVETCALDRKKINLEGELHKCTASEGLSLIQVLGHFFREALVANADASESSKAYGRVMVLLAAIVFELESATVFCCDSGRLEGLISAFLQSYVRFRCSLYITPLKRRS